MFQQGFQFYELLVTHMRLNTDFAPADLPRSLLQKSQQIICPAFISFCTESEANRGVPGGASQDQFNSVEKLQKSHTDYLCNALPRVREGGEATCYFCIVGTVIRWLLLPLLIFTSSGRSPSSRHRES